MATVERLIVDPTIEITLGEAKLLITPETLASLLLDRVRAAALPPAATTSVPGVPAIGMSWNGGIYAGIVRGDAGDRDYHLVVSATEGENLSWEAAKAWAANLERDGSPWVLPKRKEQAICYGNVPELFAGEWYWSGEKYAPAPASAWAQYFGNGRQSTYHHGFEFRARAVLHIPVGEDGR